jgi:hypothetical protein
MRDKIKELNLKGKKTLTKAKNKNKKHNTLSTWIGE